MQLIFLHGPPAAGKYTIATELAQHAGWRNLHNHLTMDVAKALYDFGADGFWPLVRQLRLTALASASEHGVPFVTYTCCYSHPDDLGMLEEIEHTIGRCGGVLRPVYLQCATEVLERRITSPARADMGKLNSVEGLRRQLSSWNCVAVPRDDCVTIQTDDKTPAQCADAILEALGWDPANVPMTSG